MSASIKNMGSSGGVNECVDTMYNKSSVSLGSNNALDLTFTVVCTGAGISDKSSGFCIILLIQKNGGSFQDLTITGTENCEAKIMQYGYRTPCIVFMRWENMPNMVRRVHFSRTSTNDIEIYPKAVYISD